MTPTTEEVVPKRAGHRHSTARNTVAAASIDLGGNGQVMAGSYDQQAYDLGLYGFEIVQILAGRRIRLADGAGGRIVTDFATNCPLGINELAEVRSAAIEAICAYGGLHSSIASARATTGLTREIAGRLNAMKGPGSGSRLYPSTLSANCAAASVLAKSGAQVVVDPHAHATVMAALKSIPADRMIVTKNSIELAGSYASTSSRPVYLVGDGLYSMGNFADFPAIRGLLSKHANARVWLDDAHSVGMHGTDGRGEAMEQLEEFSDRVVVTGSFGKAFGAAGGFLVGPASFVDEMLGASVADRFSCNVDLAGQGAILASMKLLSRPRTLRELQLGLEQRLKGFDQTLAKAGVVTEQHGSRIAFRLIPFRSPEAAIKVAGKLLADGFMTTPVYHPTITRGIGGIRVSLSSGHPVEMVDSIAHKFVNFSRSPRARR